MNDRQRLEAIINVIGQYLPPDGIPINDAMSEIIGLVDPLPPQRDSSATPRTWVGLTDVEWMNIVNKDQAWFGQRPDEVAHEVAKLVEAKLKEKNT